MEGSPIAPTEKQWAAAEEALDSNDPLQDKLVGIQVGLVGWRANPNSQVPDSRLTTDQLRERYEFQSWLFAELREFFQEMNQAGRRCEFTVGDTPPPAHALRPLGDRRALFKSGLLPAGRTYTLDYAETHTVPQDAHFDQAPGLMDSRQVYLGDTRQGVAISINQISISLMKNSELRLL